jgi:hypothetical protein
MSNIISNPETISGNGLHWWTGIIVSDESWIQNQEQKKWSDINDLSGWGSRYKVRIVGKHTDVRNRLPDDDLEVCEVIFPVTAGTGHAAAYQTSNLRQGSVVIGFYKDGIDGNEPIILGCIGNNDQTPLKRIQESGFDAYSGFKIGRDSVPLYSIVPGNSPPIPGAGGSLIRESNTCSTTTGTTCADQEEVDENTESLSSSKDCEPIPLKGLQLTIRNLILDIERFKKQNVEWRLTITNNVAEKREWINEKLRIASEKVASGIKWLITEIEKWATKSLNDKAKLLYSVIFPNQRGALKEAQQTANGAIACLFKKIIKNLFKMVYNMLSGVIDRFINTPLCAVENLVGGVIGKLGSLINSAIDAILKPINAVIQGFSLAIDVMNLVTDILSFINCEETPECPEVGEWNIWEGSGPTTELNFDNVIESAKRFGSDLKEVVDPDTYDFGSVSFEDLFSHLKDDPCGIGPLLCGPPNVEFFGGGGKGAKGNAIVSAAGEILGVDIIASGFGYRKAPFIRFVDPCGKGSGAIGKAILGKVPKRSSTQPLRGTGPSDLNDEDGDGDTGERDTGTYINNRSNVDIITDDDLTDIGTGPDDDNITDDLTDIGTGPDDGDDNGVLGVDIIDPGSGYLPFPDGDEGGDGRVWCPKESTCIQRSDGTYDPPYQSGDYICVEPGDIVKLPSGTSVTTTADELIVGGSMHIVKFSGCFTAPRLDSIETQSTTIYPGLDPIETQSTTIYPGLDDGKYPVILYLCGLIIQNRGFGYQDGDQIIIEPSYGATAVPTFGTFGELQSIQVTNGGEGFRETPNIYIQSETGYNAEIIPRFCITRVSEENLSEPTIQDKIVPIIDCVGLIPVGFVNGVAYYGSYHTHEGRKMVGASHTKRPHDYIYDTIEESINSVNTTTKVSNVTYTPTYTPIYSEPQQMEVATSIQPTTSTSTSEPTPTPTPVPTPTPAPTPAPSPSPTPSPSPYSGGY